MSHAQLSVQLYTVREAIQEDLLGSLKRIAEIGFTQVEPYNFTAVDGLGDALAEAGLTAPTTHAHFIGEDQELLDLVFSSARTLGIPTVIDPFVGPERWQNAEAIRDVAAELNAAASVAARYGIVVGYHNHAHELESVIGGTTALEIFAAALDPAVVLEIDSYWVSVGGVDPVQLIQRLGDRVVAIHIKDGPPSADVTQQVAVGSGAMPVRTIIEAAPSALRIVELDDSEGDRFQAIADSYAYLVKENLA